MNIFKHKTNELIETKQIQADPAKILRSYLDALSIETRQRFGPHAYDNASIESFYKEKNNAGYVLFRTHENKVIAYATIHKGFLLHDSARLSAYGLVLSQDTDYTYAPSVADAWQGKGHGKQLFDHILEKIRPEGAKRIILWGGVQNENERAVRYYEKLGFQTLGYFEYHGWNRDMVYTLG